jgi:hypothetical protein
MKTLMILIFCLISFISFGQTIPSGSITNATFHDTSAESIEKILFWKVIKEFKKDCYNDSTQIMNPVMVPNPDPDFSYIDGTPMKIDHYELSNPPRYSHKQPTFENFIKWLDKIHKP